ncbi:MULTISPECIES: radical SAM protein [unclassified Mesorhizobium]|uniref:radical SAM protein n=1 Tax=unclassified Mesorhizobium TaxID=325217 RepID=UPI001129B012|nr:MULTISPECIES: radical SAM protein [unclassified Mesorhizobium]TPM06132.1 radical SAM protein [Mesorhizobium sp. B2-3-8]TPM13871.1 radical SAM protein [Mesorhizobium sp. B2-3-7]
MANKRILLLEPGYKNKYPPLGLMKIAQYHGRHGKQDQVTFSKGCDKALLSQAWDRVYVTTLFSFEYQKISETIDFAISAAQGQSQRVFVGGIAASLMHERFTSDARWRGVRFIKGLLDKAPASSLQLDEFDGDFYANDLEGEPIEDLVPDYDILDQVSYRYPVRDAYFAYASRGCIRKCSFCGVPKLEGAQRDSVSLPSFVNKVNQLYGERRDLILMDNNVVASARFKEIIAEIRDLGFTPGAKLRRPGERQDAIRRVDFNQGVDARILSKDPMFLRELSSICLSPLRIAFDHLGLKGPYEKSVRISNDFGLNDLSNYMLYNFHDDPKDLFERMYLNVRLNEELGIRIYSFPMRYQPTNLPNRSHVGEKWTRYYLRSMQIILQATHGVVSGEPRFYKAAFGETYSEFEEILSRPHHMIFNRQWYERFGGRGELDDYQLAIGRLSASEKAELIAFLSERPPSEYSRDLSELPRDLRSVARFYVPLAKGQEAEIWRLQKAVSGRSQGPDMRLTEEEIVEDAGLDDDGVMEAPLPRAVRAQNRVLA